MFLTVLGVGDDNLKDSTMQKLADKANGNYAYLDSLKEARKVLVRQMNGTLGTIAKDVKIEVEFNPARVASYRLLGYEKRFLRKEDFNDDKIDAGEIGAGHTVTALYEVVPVGAGADPAASVPPVDALKYQPNEPKQAATTLVSGEILTGKLRHKKPDAERSEMTERTLNDSGASFANASPDFEIRGCCGGIRNDPARFTAQGKRHARRRDRVGAGGKGRDEGGYRAGFIELVRKARALAL